MLSTLLLLVLSGLVLQSIISISTSYIIQLNQLSSAYQAETALNMSERILNDYITENNYELPEQVDISSSAGKIRVIRKTTSEYEAIIIQENGIEFRRKIEIEESESEGQESEEGKIDDTSEDGLIPQEEIEH